jgi:hypothetical protein
VKKKAILEQLELAHERVDVLEEELDEVYARLERIEALLGLQAPNNLFTMPVNFVAATLDLLDEMFGSKPKINDEG